MQCPSCGAVGRAEAKFCDECGAPLQSHCPSCGFENRPGAKFCSECGLPVSPHRSFPLSSQPVTQREAAELQRPPTAERFAPEAERRQLTVMFCDLVGSTVVSEQLDPEDLREVVRAYQQVSAEAIGRFEGHIAQYLGDGLLVYFGYPVAHEDDAQGAVRAGLGIIRAIHELPLRNTRLSHPLQVRIGIHTGLVVVGEMGGGEKREQLALGDTPNIAARVQGIAEPDAIAISAATYRLIQGFFACRALGPQTLKGVSTSVEVYQVLGESGVQSRFEVAVTTGLTPLVGREQEVGLLLERWERAKEGAGQVVLLSGEAGIGKSRLVQVLKERAAGEPHARLECRCSPYYQNSALYPVIDLLQRVLQFTKEESPEGKLGKLERWLESYGFELKDTVPLFASLLSLPASRFPLPVLTPQRQKEKTQQAVLAWLLKEAEREPLRLTVEDLHWADPSSLELLGLLLDQVPTVRMLVLLTFRPEFSPPWASRSHLTPLALSRLSRTQAEVMVTRVTGGKGLPSEVLRQIVLKTDGVPLFVEELTKMVVESGLLKEWDGHYELTGPLPPLAIPSTLQDSLMARLDRLATVREVAQLGAALGREFSYELLWAVSPLDEAGLHQALAKLVEAELLYQRGLPPQARYVFKHALIQEAAYQSLLRSKRQQYHQQIAHVLEERFPETKETQPELLAHHYTAAGLVAQALPYWQKAGQRAVGRSAYVEGINHLTQGLALLQALPDTPERAQHELALQLTLSGALIVTKGWAAPELERAGARALELCRQVGETPHRFGALGALFGFSVMRGELRTARALAEEALALAQRLREPPLLVWAHLDLAVVLYRLGELVTARPHLEQGLALYHPQQHLVHAASGQDPGVNGHSHTALVLWCLGYPDQARKQMHAALTLAQELSHPFSLVYALSFAAGLHLSRGEMQAAHERAEALMALASEQGFPHFVAQGMVLRGGVLAMHGQAEEGITQIRQGLAVAQATGVKMGLPSSLALLAEVYGKAGRAEEGLRVLAEVLALVDKTAEHFSEAELYRLKGELTLQQSKVQSLKSKVNTPQSAFRNPQLEAKAEACFLKAIEVARRQSAKSWELRAVMSLSRLWQQQSKKEDARRMLAEIYGWFTEGFDTKDLQEARALLEELS